MLISKRFAPLGAISYKVREGVAGLRLKLIKVLYSGFAIFGGLNYLGAVLGII